MSINTSKTTVIVSYWVDKEEDGLKTSPNGNEAARCTKDIHRWHNVLFTGNSLRGRHWKTTIEQRVRKHTFRLVNQHVYIRQTTPASSTDRDLLLVTKKDICTNVEVKSVFISRLNTVCSSSLIGLFVFSANVVTRHQYRVNSSRLLLLFSFHYYYKRLILSRQWHCSLSNHSDTFSGTRRRRLFDFNTYLYVSYSSTTAK